MPFHFLHTNRYIIKGITHNNVINNIDLINCQANISTEPGNQQKIEATITVPKGKLVASASHEDLYKAINEVEHKLERQLNKLSHKPEAKRTKVEKLDVEEEAEVE